MICSHNQNGLAAAAVKSLQSCPTLCDPIDVSPPGSPIPGILQARTLEWVAISFSNAWKWKVKVKSLSRVRLSDPMDRSLPGSSIHGIFQARVLEWGAIAFCENEPKKGNLWTTTWTMDYQMFKLDSEKTEESEIKLPKSAGPSKEQESSQKNIYFCFIDYDKAFDCVDHNKLWKILKEMGIPDHLTCFLINLYADQEATVRTGHGTPDWFQIRKGIHQSCILSLCLFNTQKNTESCKILSCMKHKME